jgi:ubiquinone/menaquinone biosynthesis C-methylase UbiE
LNYQVSAFVASFILSIGNYLVSSTYIFSSTIDPHLTDLEKIYGKVPNDFYDQQQATMNPLRSWFHRRRQELINLEVNKRLKEISNPTIVDLGCGNCAWNIQKLPVIGVDLSPHLLQYALENKRLSKTIIAPTDNTNLPDNTADLVIISEVIEHLPDPNPTLQEIERILKPNGILLVTVPFDTNLSFWKPLFTLQCFLQGNILRSIYYLNKCGHVKAYSPKTIQELLEKRFKVIEQFSMRRFTIFSICRKQPV